MSVLSLASGILFFIWVSIVVVVIGAWAFKTLNQDNDISGLK